MSWAGIQHEVLVRDRILAQGEVKQAVEQEALVLGVPTVEAERELAEVPLDVLLADGALVRSEKPALQRGRDVVCAGENARSIERVAVLAPKGRLVDDLVLITELREVQVATPAVGPDLTARLDSLLDETIEARATRVWQDHQAAPAETPRCEDLDRDARQHLRAAAATITPRLETVDEGLVHLDDTP